MDISSRLVKLIKEMNNLIILLICITPFSKLNAQLIVNGTDVNKSDVQYIMLIADERPYSPVNTSTQIRIWLDFGQGLDTTRAGELLKKGASTTAFRSVVEAMNYLYKSGWDLMYQCVLGQNVYASYVFRRRYPLTK